MRILKIFSYRWKACLRQPYIWVFIVLAILAAMIPASSAKYKSDSRFPIGIVNEDNRTSSSELEAYLETYDRLMIFKLDREQALRNLAMGRLEAVYVINDGFTAAVQSGRYEGLITMFTAPASSAAVLLSETVINSALMVWMTETALQKVDVFLTSENIPFTPEIRQEMRLEFTQLLHNGSKITVRDHIPAPARTGGTYDALLRSSGWYAALVVLFVVTGAGWVIESRKNALGQRMRAVGIHPMAALAGSSLAVIVFSMLGWLAATLAAAVVSGFPVTAGLVIIVPMLLYMIGILGLTLLVSSLLDRTVHLMLLAPVFTITQGIMCGMLFEMPNWAGLLYFVSYLFPGRWFMLAADAVLSGDISIFMLGLFLCALFWIVLGSVTVLVKSRRAMAHAG